MSKLEILEGTKFYPACVALEVTLRCNMKCLHCGSKAEGSSRSNELSLEEWKSIVDELVLMGTEYFTLSGGEPFVWHNWRGLAKYISEKGKTLSIISNGYKITDDDIKFLKDAGLWNIGLSIDGLKDVHEKIRRTPGSFDRVIEAINGFKTAGIKVAISTSVNKLNYHDLEKLKWYLSACGVDLWQVQVVNSFGRAGEYKEQLIIDRRQYAGLVEFVYNSQQEHKSGGLKMDVMPADSIGYCHEIAENIWGDMEWSGCNAGRYVMGIQSNGDVIGCLSLQDKIFVAGNVRQRSLAEIWNDDSAFAYNRKFDADKLNGPCAGCTKGAQCRSGCLSMGYSVSGKLYNNPYCYKSIKEGVSNAEL